MHTNMASTISVRLDESLLKDLYGIEKSWQADRSEAVRRLLVKAITSWKIQDALDKLRGHKISLGKAAQDCKLSVWEMLALAREHNLNWTGYSREDLEKDIKLLEGK